MYIATCPPSVEDLLEAELISCGAQGCRRLPGGVSFAGPPEAALKACIYARVASRVLWVLARFDATNRDALYRGVTQMDWPALLAPGASIGVSCSRGEGALDHTHFVALVTKDGIVDAMRAGTGARPDVDSVNPGARLHVHIRRGQAQVAFDLSGESLHRRGYRHGGGAAPLKENLAAAMLMRSGWPPWAAAGGLLLDPMCGSATLLIEAALMAMGQPANAHRRRFGAEGWRGLDWAAWQALRNAAWAEAKAGLAAPRPWRLRGADVDPAQLAIARSQLRQVGLEDVVVLAQADVAELAAPKELCGAPGMVVTNPPYGARIGGDDATIQALMATLGRGLGRLSGWHAHVLVADREMGYSMGLRAHRTHALTNGPIPVTLLHIKIAADDVGDEDAPAQPRAGRAAMVANRLAKNQRRLAPYLRQHGITAYRLYDADLPEYAAAIDVYTDVAGQARVHVQEYAPPAQIPTEVARARLRDLLLAVGQVLQVPPQAIALKQRRRQTASERYGAQEARAHPGARRPAAKASAEASPTAFWVEEAGLRYRVDLHAYVDTGLFLDHRLVRAWLRQRAAGKRVLNLFGYTGSVTVAAAAGGAQQTITVDLSRTYLNWCEDNLLGNGLAAPQHKLIQADCLAWLAQAPKGDDDMVDFAFVNPPTFSNSKRMQHTFDVVADHGPLLHATMQRLGRHGAALFTTHAARLRLDADLTATYVVREMTKALRPQDFGRAGSGCRAWLLSHRPKA